MSIPPGSRRTLVLNSVGSDPVSLFNLKTGLRLTYDASDKLGNKWQMTMLVQEQVTFGGHTYFRVPPERLLWPRAKPGVYT